MKPNAGRSRQTDKKGGGRMSRSKFLVALTTLWCAAITLSISAPGIASATTVRPATTDCSSGMVYDVADAPYLMAVGNPVVANGGSATFSQARYWGMAVDCATPNAPYTFEVFRGSDQALMAADTFTTSAQGSGGLPYFGNAATLATDPNTNQPMQFTLGEQYVYGLVAGTNVQPESALMLTGGNTVHGAYASCVLRDAAGNPVTSISINGGDAVTLDCSGSQDVDDQPNTTMTYDWGNGSITKVTNDLTMVRHTFYTAGTYTLHGTISDDGANELSAVSNAVTVTVASSVTPPPTAVEDDSNVDQNSTQGQVIDVLSNDTPAGISKCIDAVTQPANGTAQLTDANGNPVPASDCPQYVTYVPNRDFAGVDRFTYTPSDVTGAGDPGNVVMTVRALKTAYPVRGAMTAYRCGTGPEESNLAMPRTPGVAYISKSGPTKGQDLSGRDNIQVRKGHPQVVQPTAKPKWKLPRDPYPVQTYRFFSKPSICPQYVYVAGFQHRAHHRPYVDSLWVKYNHHEVAKTIAIRDGKQVRLKHGRLYVRPGHRGKIYVVIKPGHAHWLCPNGKKRILASSIRNPRHH